jgi:hypothetical protein
MIQNYDKISRWNVETDKIYTLWEIHVYFTMINTKHMILGQSCVFLITSCKRFHSKILLYEKVKKNSLVHFVK